MVTAEHAKFEDLDQRVYDLRAQQSVATSTTTSAFEEGY